MNVNILLILGIIINPNKNDELWAYLQLAAFVWSSRIMVGLFLKYIWIRMPLAAARIHI